SVFSFTSAFCSGSSLGAEGGCAGCSFLAGDCSPCLLSLSRFAWADDWLVMPAGTIASFAQKTRPIKRTTETTAAARMNHGRFGCLTLDGTEVDWLFGTQVGNSPSARPRGGETTFCTAAPGVAGCFSFSSSACTNAEQLA